MKLLVALTHVFGYVLNVQAWGQAASLAMSYQKHRMYDVIETVSARLCEIGRHGAAGELHEQVDDVQVRNLGGSLGELGRRSCRLAVRTLVAVAV